MEVESSKPILLILTKKDLESYTDDPVDIKALRQASKAEGCQGAMATSSKAWEDFNVHTAFNKALKTAYMNKYDDDEDVDDD